MFAAIWIDESKKSAHEKIVVCTPLMGRLNTAIAVLRSESHEAAKCVIISGDPELLKTFIARLNEADESWDHLTSAQLIETISKASVQAGISVVPANSEVTAAIKRVPKPGAYPLLITPDAKPLWDFVTMEHKDVLARYKSDKEKMWAVAIILLKRYCDEHGVAPFSKDPDQRKLRRMSSVEFHKRVNNGNFKALEATQMAFDHLREIGKASRLTTEKFFESAKSASMYYITTVQVAKLKVAPADAISALRDIGWITGPKYAHKHIDSTTDVLAEPEGKDLAFYHATRITQDEVILLFGLSDDASDAHILKTMSAAGRKWVKTGILVEIPR